ncbi:protein phosphatase CheZ [Solimicrobium silvestre]|uniref:Protein phosphatase CheZ n=1 Tax=Solimicrobium silvestre TaxID=2099400 RepID=A0A2S9GUC7_9BURK|nr:protein phosphatase CheZ [Solimicrobium silvestre]PRC91308.1 Chemotaxis protein [Solimicrobium silvestre]
MNDSDEDLEALFEEMASQPAAAAQSTPAVATQATSTTQTSSNSEEAEVDSNANKPIFERLGGVVRVLHDSMRELGYDRSLAEVTSQITDAHGRLEYIATLTEQAANKVLNATDEGMPAQDELAKKAKDIDERWTSLFKGQMSIEAFKTLASDSQKFAKDAIASTEAEKARLLSIMMSQDFQDLTGQLIKKVVTITSAVEHELAQILIDNAPAMSAILKDKPVELMEGPSVPASAMEQDDVDNLLDSLGF